MLSQVTLPPDTAGPAKQTDWSDIATAALMQPLGPKVARALYRRVKDPHAPPRRTDALLDVTVPIVASLVAAALAFLIGGVWAFERRRRRLWVALGVALGPLGVLLMLSLFGWPTRERCASCARKRVVTRVRCEHCDAPFPPPPPDGTEIFEPARS